MNVLNFIFRIINGFFSVFVMYKIYQWYSPEVGFDLPELSYLQVLALSTIIGVLKGNVQEAYMIATVYQNTKEDSVEKSLHQITIAFMLLFILGGGYVLNLIFY